MLAFLAPTIVEAVAEGRQPIGLTAASLTAQGELNPIWSQQKQDLGWTAIEREINGRAAAERCAVRQARVAPLVAELEGWMRAERTRLSRHAEAAKAMDYMLKRWDAFARFIGDGRICLTNNAAERALRGIAIGRKNWLFAGSDRGGQRAAAMYTLIATAKLNNLDPQAWLADVLRRIANHPATRLHELLPWNWRPPKVDAAA
jgi:transposase